MRVRLSIRAERDLDDIWFYLAIQASEAIATRTVSDLWNTVLRLEAFPALGSPRPNVGRDLRLLVCGSYEIYYLVLETEVVMTRVAHGSQDVSALAGLNDVE